MEYPIEGSCQCGQITYKLKKAPGTIFACHCTECQKLATAPYSVTAIIATEDIEFYGDLKEWSRSSDSGNINTAKFCPNCGNRIYHINPDDLSTIKLKLKPIHKETASIFEPTIHLWVNEKLDWVEIPDDVKVFPKGPQ